MPREASFLFFYPISHYVEFSSPDERIEELYMMNNIDLIGTLLYQCNTVGVVGVNDLGRKANIRVVIAIKCTGVCTIA